MVESLAVRASLTLIQDEFEYPLHSTLSELNFSHLRVSWSRCDGSTETWKRLIETEMSTHICN